LILKCQLKPKIEVLSNVVAFLRLFHLILFTRQKYAFLSSDFVLLLSVIYFYYQISFNCSFISCFALKLPRK
jgi:hypothetical protein